MEGCLINDKPYRRIFFVIAFLSVCFGQVNRVAAQDETCNVRNAELDLEVIISGGLVDQEARGALNIISPAAIVEDGVRIVDSEGAGIAATFWFTEFERLADGFAATFSFVIAGKYLIY